MLNPDWLLEGHPDFEYKQYILLGYLKKVKEKFDKVELYPHLSELIHHYKNLKHIQHSKDSLIDEMPKTISGLDIQKLSIIYSNRSLDKEVSNELFDVINYALPKMERAIENGKTTYEFVEKHISIEPVGLLPLYKNEGYFILDTSSNHNMVYRFKITHISSMDEKLIAINSEFVTKRKKSLLNHYQQIKLDLIKNYKELPNPATYVIQTELALPLQHTLIPITERLLLRQSAA